MTGVVVPYWPDQDALEALAVADAAERLDYDELWVGEMATFDAFALATAVVGRTERIAITVGPLAVGVRDPAALALGVASVAALGARRVELAVGASTPVLVDQWHGRTWRRSVSTLRETVQALRPLLAGEKSSFAGAHARSHGFRLRVAPPGSTITVAAFGQASVAVAGQLADRMVINLVTPLQAERLRGMLDSAAEDAGRPSPPLAAWVMAAVDPTEQTYAQARQALVAYLAAPGYGEMFAEAGFGDLVAEARAGAHPRALFAAIPAELIEAVGAFGDLAAVRQRMGQYRAAGVDNIAIVPATAGDPAGERTLAALAKE